MLIGITGGIGSGKSTIAGQLCKMGYAVYDSDKEAKRLIEEDTAIRRQITAVFGEEAYAGGQYQTAWVARRVFAEPELLAQLNAIVHPAVRRDLAQWTEAKKGEKEWLFVECAIIYQAGIDALCAKVVAVTAPEAVRLARVMARDGKTEEQVMARMQAQRTEEAMQQADMVVMNDGKASVEALCEQMITELKNSKA